MGLFKRNANTGSPKVSVLVPVYNVEKFLEPCLESLKNQSLSEIEFICINDGSTDRSRDILQRYAESDNRFRIIDKTNSGYGASMNRGLDEARGEYVGIVESDDFADPSMFKTLYKFASRHQCDLVKSNYYEHCGGKDAKMEVFHDFPYRTVFDPADMMDAIKVLPIIWAAIYRREMLVENDIRFNETPGASFQDTSFVFKAWVASKRAALLPGAYLHYRVDNASSSVKSASKIFEVCIEYRSSESFLEERPDERMKYAALLNIMKLNTYRWNYNRIAPEYREEFAETWADEFRSADSKGTLSKDYFSEHDWKVAQELMADTSAFCEKYREEL